MEGWLSVKNDPPKEGTLCLVYFPIGVYNVTGDTFGPIAAAYREKEGWKMADTPTPLRGALGEFGPSYWQEFSVNRKH